MSQEHDYVYQVIWEYQVQPQNRKKFELEYGPSGSWNKLFTQSQNYLGSSLLNNEQRDECYLLIDNWINKQSYVDFIRTHQKTYDNLCLKLESLYASEKKIGAFYAVAP